MSQDVKWILTATDNASGVFHKVHDSGKQAATGITGAFEGMIGKIGAIGAVISTIASGWVFKDAIDSTVKWTMEVNKLGRTLGLTAQEASVWRVAAQLYGVDVELMEKAGLKLAKTLGSNEDVFKKLGVATRDSSGHLRSTAQLLPEVNQKLSELKAGTDRNVMAMQIYGRSWGEVQSMLKLTPAAMAEALKAATDLHLIIGPEGIERTKEYQKNMRYIGLVFESIKIQLGEKLLPYLIQFGEWLSGHGGTIINTFCGYLQVLGKWWETIGLTAKFAGDNMVTSLSALNKLAHGDIAGAVDLGKGLMNRGMEYSAKMQKLWTDWSTPKSKASGLLGNMLDQEAGAAEQKIASLNEKLRESLAKANGDPLGLIDLEAAKYREAGADKILIEQWVAAEKDKILNKSMKDAFKILDKSMEEQSKRELKQRDEYAKINIATLEASGDVVAAEIAKQNAYKQTEEYMLLMAKAEQENAEGEKARLALMDINKQHTIALVEKQNQMNETMRQQAADFDAVRFSTNGLSDDLKALVEMEKAYADGLRNESAIEDQVNLAMAKGNTALAEMLRLKKEMLQLNNTVLLQQTQEAEQMAVLAGKIVGFNDGVAIWADGVNKATAATRDAAGANNMLADSINGVATAYQLLEGNPKDAWLAGFDKPASSFNVGSNFMGWYGAEVLFNSKVADFWKYRARAGGGSVVAGEPYIVGERRPEIFVPSQNGTIYPSVGSGGVTIASGGIQISVQSTGNADYDADRLARALVPKLRKYMGDTRNLAAA